MLSWEAVPQPLSDRSGASERRARQSGRNGPMFIDCTACNGKGKRIEAGFDGRTAVACGDCTGAGEVELTADETAIMEAFLAECAAGIAAVETVAEVETFLVATNTSACIGSDAAPIVPVPSHPNMSAAFFDDGVR